MRILVSACLLGTPCRYDGGAKASAAVLKLMDSHELIPVCPEQLGGLSTPRPPCELRGGRVVSRQGDDRTDAFIKGADEALRLYRLLRCEAAILKSRSPSCGKHLIYDGSFTGVLVSGSGICARTLLDEGIRVLSEEEPLVF